MAQFYGREYDLNVDGIAHLLRQLCLEQGSAATPRVEFINLPINAIEVEYGERQGITVRLPQVQAASPEWVGLTDRWLRSWSLFVAVRMRYPDLAGRCILRLDDRPDAEGLAFCSNVTSNVLIPDPDFLFSKGYSSLRRKAHNHLLPWRERKDQIYWRGSSTGDRRDLKSHDVRNLPRVRLCLLAKQWGREDLFDIGVSHIVQLSSDEVEEIHAAGIVRPGVAQEEFGNYKYSIDIDGNTNSWAGMLSKFILGNTVLKIDSLGGFRQWYYDLLIPWHNFVPIDHDMNQLRDIATWLRTHQDAAEAIAQRGRALAERLSFDAVIDVIVPRIKDALRPAEASGAGDGVAVGQPAVVVNAGPATADAKRTYILTAHNTIVGVGERIELIQLDASTDQACFVSIDDPADGEVIEGGPLTGFTTLRTDQGVSFTKYRYYLCAEGDRKTVVVNRRECGIWETFQLLSVEDLEALIVALSVTSSEHAETH